MDRIVIFTAICSGEFREEETCLAAFIEKSDILGKTVFDLDSFSDQDCLDYLWLDRRNIHDIWLKNSEEICTSNGSLISGLWRLCVLLRRPAYPNRWTDIKQPFGRSIFELSLLLNWTMGFIYSSSIHLLIHSDLLWLSSGAMQDFAAVVYRKGGSPENWCIFINGTVRLICSPSKSQRASRNAHYRVHAVTL